MRYYKKIRIQKRFICIALLLILISVLCFGCEICGTPENDFDAEQSQPAISGTNKSESDISPPIVCISALPEGFSYIDSSIIIELRYATSYNFTGAPVAGYEAQVGIMTSEGCAALLEAEHLAESMGYKLKVYDAYRPVRAVESFVAWAGNDDESMKDIFYPNISKKDLYSLGYISGRSAHSRGGAVDVALVDINTLVELDMGSYFDFYDPISHFHSELISPEQQANRNTLRDIMERCGFRYYKNEWWHYILIDEHFPDTYFDFPVQ